MTRLRENIKETQTKLIQKVHWHPKILSCQVNSRKITVELEDQREISLPLNLIIKEWFCLKENEIKWEQLKNYKIWGGGYTILFPDLEEDIPVRIFTEGINSSCCC